jgi:RNA polymerase sigma-70 factor (ECF subfamily)
VLATPDSAPAADALFDTDPELAAAWRTLSARHREVLALVVLEEVPVAEAAIALEVSANAVSVRLHRAKKALAEALEATRATTSRRSSDISDAGERSEAPAT